MAKNVEYKVLQGLDYPPNKRAEIGDVVSDLPKESISWLLSNGHIQAASAEKIVEEIVAEVIEALSNDEPLEEVIEDAE